MKIAIISDIHGNLEALNKTLEDIKKRKCDEIICLGDIIAKGIHSSECVKLIKEKCKVVIQGNCDRYFTLEHKNIENLPEIEVKRINWNKHNLNDEEINYLRNLPYCYEFFMSGSLVRLFHATPKVDNEAVINLDGINRKYEMFLPSENTISQNVADVVIYGHLHHQYMDRLYNKTLINAGSVGNSYDVIRNDLKDSNLLETTNAQYLIIEGEFGSKEYNMGISYQFIKVPYDIEKELSSNSLNIERENYTYELKYGKYRNMQKINDNFKNIGIDISKI